MSIKYIKNLSKKTYTSSLSLQSISSIVKNIVEDFILVNKEKIKLESEPYVRTKNNKTEIFIHLVNKDKKSELDENLCKELDEEVSESLKSLTEMNNFKIFITTK